MPDSGRMNWPTLARGPSATYAGFHADTTMTPLGHRGDAAEGVAYGRVQTGPTTRRAPR
jgi:hypothetical protein